MSRANLAIPHLILACTGGIVGYTLLAGSALGFVLVLRHLEALPPMVFKDAAAFVANDFLLEISKGASPLAGLQSAALTVHQASPSASLVYLGPHERVIAADKECLANTAESSAVSNTEIALRPDFPARSACAGKLLLSSIPLSIGKSGEELKIYAARDIDRHFFSKDAGRLALGYLVPPFFFLSLGAGLSLLLFHRLFQRHVHSLIAKMQATQAGGTAVLDVSTPIFELNDMAERFNEMTNEEEIRLRVAREEIAMRKELLTGLIHDVKTPLTALSIAAERWSKTEDATSIQRYRAIISTSLNTQAEIATMLEDLANLTAQSQTVKKEKVDAANIMKQSYTQFLPLAEAKGIAFHLLCEEGCCFAEINRSMVQRAVDNLVGNSIAYTPKGGEIELSFQLADGKAEYEVSDSGPGVATADLPRMGEQFFRGSRTASQSGSGLGLAIVRKVTALHDGDFSIRNRHERGTLARISIPLLPEKQENLESSNPRSTLEENEEPRSSFRSARLSVSAAWFAALVSLFMSAESSAATKILTAASIVWLVAHLLRSRSTAVHFAAWVGVPAYISSLLFAISQREAVPAVLCGMSATITTLFLFSVMASVGRVRPGLLFVLPPLFAAFFRPIFGLAVVGSAAGLPIIISALLYDVSPHRSRMANIIRQSILLYGIVTAFLFCASLHFFASAMLQLAYRDDGQRLLKLLSSEFSLKTGNLLAFEEHISRLQVRNPFVDLLLYDELGNPLANGGMQYAEGSRLPVPPGELEGNLLGTELGTPFGAASIIVWKRAFLGENPVILAAHVPSRRSTHYSGRSFQFTLAWYLLSLWTLAVPIFLIAYRRMNRIIRDRFEIIGEGLKRFRNKNYSSPIVMETNDLLAVAVRHINLLALRLQTLWIETNNRRQTFDRFLFRCAADLRKTAEGIKSLVPVSDTPLSAKELRLMKIAATQQRLTFENLLEVFRIERARHTPKKEEIPVKEVYAEEIIRAKELSAKNGDCVTLVDQTESPVLQGDPELFVLLIRHLYRLAANTGEETRLVLDGADTSLRMSVVLRNTTLTGEEQIHPSCSPTSHEFSAWPSLGGYETTLLFEKSRHEGWSIELVRLEDSDIRVVIHLSGGGGDKNG